MTIGSRFRAPEKRHLVAVLGIAIASLFLPLHASAALGGNVSSVESDQLQMKAKRSVRNNGKYSVHEISTNYGDTVREYVSPDGRVFGVAWRGPFLPNLQQLLGDYYATFSQEAQAERAETTHSRRASMVVNRSDLVMYSGGHARAFAGHAYVPGMIPSGVDAKEIQ